MAKITILLDKTLFEWEQKYKGNENLCLWDYPTSELSHIAEQVIEDNGEEKILWLINDRLYEVE